MHKLRRAVASLWHTDDPGDRRPGRSGPGLLIKTARPLLAVLLFIGAVVVLVEWSGLRAYLDLESIRRTLVAHRISGLLVFVLLFALGNLIQIPGSLFLAAAVLALGRNWGGLVTYVAAVISCVFSFLTIRAVGGDALRRFDGVIAGKIFRHLDAQPIRSILLLRLLFQTLPALNYALAMSGVRFRQHLTGTLLGLPLPIALYCLFFDFIARLLKIPLPGLPP